MTPPARDPIRAPSSLRPHLALTTPSPRPRSQASFFSEGGTALDAYVPPAFGLPNVAEGSAISEGANAVAPPGAPLPHHSREIVGRLRGDCEKIVGPFGADDRLEALGGVFVRGASNSLVSREADGS